MSSKRLEICIDVLKNIAVDNTWVNRNDMVLAAGICLIELGVWKNLEAAELLRQENELPTVLEAVKEN
jgi:hypothetical protein